MSWKALLQSLVTHLLFGVVMFWVGWFAKPPPKAVTIDLTEAQRQQIIQDARIGWITLDSAKAMIEMKSRIRWLINYKDSVVIRDSVNVRDSVVFIPVYEANDTTIYFNEQTPKAKVTLAMKLKQRFFPLQEKFASDLTLMNLSVDVPGLRSSPIYYGNRYSIGLGIGTRFDKSFFVGDFTYKPVNTKHFELQTILEGYYNKKLTGGLLAKMRVKF